RGFCLPGPPEHVSLAPEIASGCHLLGGNMLTAALGIHDGLMARSRLPSLSRAAGGIRAVEIATLLAAGIAAASLVSFAKLHLRIPGHAVLLAVFPTALGLALVPRRLSGCVIGGSALATAGVFRAAGVGDMGGGAMTSLCLIGPLLDAALFRAHSGW